MLKFTKFRKGQSAMVATVLLIMMAILAGVLVTTFSQKSTEKVSDKIVELGTSVECNDIRLSLDVDGTEIVMKNRGTLGINKVVLRKYFEATIETKEIDDFNGKSKLLPGKDEVTNELVEFRYDLSEFDNGVEYNRIEGTPIFINEEDDLIGCNVVSHSNVI
tara:strand:+ start:818 stop:1303 length:486 start_codon:yes stop_codon:yes gene_type:complete